MSKIRKFFRAVNEKLAETSPLSKIYPFNKVQKDGRNHIKSVQYKAVLMDEKDYTQLSLIKNSFAYENKSNRKIRITIEALDGAELGIQDFVVHILGGEDFTLNIPSASEELLDLIKEVGDKYVE